jgi:2,4-dienoyl-CoA reductase-like NADH-dependent reductase (Old Yellow Enzyme family)
MTAAPSVLFSPLRIGNLTVRGRIYKASTTESGSADGFVTDSMLEFYQPFFQAKTPLVVSGSLYVSTDGKLVPLMCGADADDKIPGIRRLADQAHREGTLLFAQLSHGGREVIAGLGGGADGDRHLVSASAVTEPFLRARPRALTTAEVRQMVDTFARAAERCAQAGCDGVEIHAGHGFLISQFLTPHTNRRTDEYGGSLRRRTRFLLEIIATIRQRLGSSIALTAKMNGFDYLPGRRGLHSDELVEIARMMQEEGLDAVTVTVGHFESGAPMLRGKFRPLLRGFVDGGMGSGLPAALKRGVKVITPLASAGGFLLWRHREGFNARYAKPFVQRLTIPVISVGGFSQASSMEHAIEGGFCHAVASARAMIADPFLVRHLQTQGRADPLCDFCNACIARTGSMPVDCYHPALGRRRVRMLAREAAALSSSRT